MKNTKLKIAIIAGRDFRVKNDTDGGSVFLEYLTRSLQKRGALTDVFFPLGLAGAIFNENRARKQKSLAKSGHDFNGARVIYFPIVHAEEDILDKGEDYFLRRLAHSAKIADYFSSKILFSYDVIYILHLANAAAIMKRELSPRERTIVFPMMTSEHYKVFCSVPKAYTVMEKDALLSAKHISSPSEDEIEKLKMAFSIPDEKFFKVHRGFDEKDFPSRKSRPKRLDKKTITIFSANGIRPQKDHLFFVLLAKELKRLGWKPKIHLTGNSGASHNPVYNKYAALFWETVEKENVRENFIAHGVIPRSAMVKILRRSDFAVYPSITETFGKSALESAASGVPTVVCSDVPSFGEFIKDGESGVIVPRDPKLFAEKLIEIMADDDLYNRISRGGIALRRNFSWKAVMDNLFENQRKRGITSR